MQIKFVHFVFVFALLAQIGCAGTATGSKTSSIKVTESLPTSATASAGSGPAVLAAPAHKTPVQAIAVVLRFPALIESSAREDFIRSFHESVIAPDKSPKAQQPSRYGRPDQAEKGPNLIKAENPVVTAESSRVAEDTVRKSAYLAMELYQELASRLNPSAIVLDPVRISKGADGKIVAESIIADVLPPRLLTIDFMVYSNPSVVEMMESPTLTFGDIVTPLISVKSSIVDSPLTGGLILASEPLLETEPLAIGIEDEGGRRATALEFLNGIKADRPQYSRATRLPPKEGEVFPYRVEKLKLDESTITSYESNPENTVRRPLGEALREFTEFIAIYVATANWDRATLLSTREFIGEYDPQLEAPYPHVKDMKAYASNFALLNKIAENEVQFLSERSRRLSQALYEGTYGRSMRKLIAAEYKHLEDRRKQARKQNFNTFLAVASGALGAYAGSRGNYLGMGAGITGASVGATAAAEAAELSVQFSADYDSEFQRVYQDQARFAVSVVGGETGLSVATHNELREKMKDVYTKFKAHQIAQNPAYEIAIASDCKFPVGFDGQQWEATWGGVCYDGHPTGAGLGIFPAADGRLGIIEGSFKDGTYAGPLTMIVPDESTRLWTVAEFANVEGALAGLVKNQKPGRKPEYFRISQGSKPLKVSEEEFLAARRR